MAVRYLGHVDWPAPSHGGGTLNLQPRRSLKSIYGALGRVGQQRRFSSLLVLDGCWRDRTRFIGFSAQ